MTEQTWANVGKGLVVLATLAGLVVSIGLISDRVNRPSLTGTIEVTETPRLGEITELLDVAAFPGKLAFEIDEMRRKGAIPEHILKEIEAKIRARELSGEKLLKNAFTVALPPPTVDISVLNDGGDVARAVELVMPGSGSAQIFELGGVFGNVPTIAWTGKIPLGDIPSGSSKIVRLWPDFRYVDIRTGRPALIYAGGNGKIFEIKKFYGRSAEFFSWYNSQNHMSKSVTIFFALLPVFLGLGFLHRQGYLVLKVKRKRPENAV